MFDRIIRALTALSVLVIVASIVIVCDTGITLAAHVPTPIVTTVSQPARPTIDSAANLEALFDTVIAAQLAEENIPGAAVAVVKDGKLLLAKGYGYTDLERQVPVVAERTLFRTGSVGKLFTWTVVMQLVEQGKLDLHADVNRYLEEFQIPSTFPEPITLAHLMTHTAGFEEHMLNIYVPSANDLRPVGPWLAANMPHRVRAPGQLTSYSNYGTVLAAHIVERVSGEPFAQYLERHIFAPLRMGRTTLEQPIPARFAPDIARSFAAKGDDTHEVPFEIFQIWPAGSSSSTATDMANFMIAHLQHGRFGMAQLMDTITAREMQRQQFTHDPRLPGVTYGFFEATTNGQRSLWHGGNTNGFRSLLHLLPEQNIGLYVVYSSPAGDQARYDLWQAFMDHYFPTELPSHSEPQPGAAERALEVAGTYWSTRRDDSSHAKAEQLTANVVISPAGNGEIVGVVGGMQLRFAEVEPWVYREVGSAFVGTLVFRHRKLGNGMYAFMANFPPWAMEQMPWHANANLHLSLLAVSLTTAVVVVVGWAGLGVGTLIGLRASRSPRVSPTSLIAGLSGGAVLATLGALYVSFNDGITFLAYGPSLAVRTFGLLALLLGVVATGAAVVAWRVSGPPLLRRLHISLGAIAALLLVGELLYWNLLGF